MQFMATRLLLWCCPDSDASSCDVMASLLLAVCFLSPAHAFLRSPALLQEVERQLEELYQVWCGLHICAA